MNGDLRWLFGAFALGWMIIFGYLAWISGKERSLRRQLAALREVFDRSQES
jgi:hypothetical protein